MKKILSYHLQLYRLLLVAPVTNSSLTDTTMPDFSTMIGPSSADTVITTTFFYASVEGDIVYRSNKLYVMKMAGWLKKQSCNT